MPTSLAAMLALINDNTSGDISAADVRTVIQGLWDWVPPLEKYKMGRQAGETAHASDDFFTTYSGYTEQTPTGTAVWGVSRAGLSCVMAGQAGNDICAALKAVPAAGVPTTIETWASDALSATNNPGWGLIFTNGTASTSSLVGIGKLNDTSTRNLYTFAGTLTSVTATILSGSPRPHAADAGQYPLRLTWASSNTFAWSTSSDTQNWTDFSAGNLTPTLTPTHMGLFATSWGSSETEVASFRYLRVYDANLTV